MSWVGTVTGWPSCGRRRMLAESMRMRASAWASALSGTWMAIWSPSKSALYAVQTSGWSLSARPSTRIGSKGLGCPGGGAWARG